MITGVATSKPSPNNNVPTIDRMIARILNIVNGIIFFKHPLKLILIDSIKGTSLNTTRGPENEKPIIKINIKIKKRISMGKAPLVPDAAIEVIIKKAKADKYN